MVDTRLKTFLTLYKAGSYTKASELLYISQPSVTNHIKSLERELNCKLFYSENKKLKLTKPGEIVLEYANRQIHAYNRFVSMIENANKVSNDINMASKGTISEFYLPEIIAKWQRKYPESKIQVKIKQEKDMFDALDSGEVNFVVTDQMIDKRIGRFIYKPIKKQNIILVVGSGHPLASRKEVSLKDLENEKWFLTGHNSKYKSLKHKFMLHNLNIQNIIDYAKIESENIIYNLVKENLGLTFVTEDFVRKDLDNGSLVKVGIKDFNIMKDLMLVYVEDSIEKDVILEFYKMFVDTVNSHKSQAVINK